LPSDERRQPPPPPPPAGAPPQLSGAPTPNVGEPVRGEPPKRSGEPMRGKTPARATKLARYAGIGASGSSTGARGRGVGAVEPLASAAADSPGSPGRPSSAVAANAEGMMSGACIAASCESRDCVSRPSLVCRPPPRSSRVNDDACRLSARTLGAGPAPLQPLNRSACMSIGGGGRRVGGRSVSSSRPAEAVAQGWNGPVLLRYPGLIASRRPILRIPGTLLPLYHMYAFSAAAAAAALGGALNCISKESEFRV
jgi:hypothetical protein